MSRLLNEKTLKRFLQLASERLTGEWVLLGGTVLPLLGRDYRSTTDIDFVPVGEVSMSENLKIMQICEELGLPIETVNGAAQFFLSRIPHFKNHLILISESVRSKIYRPNLYLFIELKIARLAASDLTDCLEMLKLDFESLSATQKKFLKKKAGLIIQNQPDQRKERGRLNCSQHSTNDPLHHPRRQRTRSWLMRAQPQSARPRPGHRTRYWQQMWGSRDLRG